MPGTFDPGKHPRGQPGNRGQFGPGGGGESTTAEPAAGGHAATGTADAGDRHAVAAELEARAAGMPADKAAVAAELAGRLRDGGGHEPAAAGSGIVVHPPQTVGGITSPAREHILVENKVTGVRVSIEQNYDLQDYNVGVVHRLASGADFQATSARFLPRDAAIAKAKELAAEILTPAEAPKPAAKAAVPDLPRSKRDVQIGPEKQDRSKAGVFYSRGIKEDVADATAERLFAGSDDLYADMAAVSGMPDDAKLRITEVGKYEPLYSDDKPLDASGFRVAVEHPKIEKGKGSMFVGVDAAGKRFTRMEIIEVKKEFRADGLGSQILAKQAESASSEGFDYMSLHAAGGPGGKYNGYYTWPRFGYDQPLADLPAADRDRVGAAFPAAKSVLDVMATKEGRDWWKANGTELLDARFDLTPGSRSMRVLADYLAERSRAGTTKPKSN